MAPRYLVLKEERHDLTTEWASLSNAAEAESRDLSTEEIARTKQIEARISAVDEQLLVEERRREIERNAPPAPQYTPITGVHDLAEDRPWASMAEQLMAVRTAALPGGYVDPRLGFGAIPLGSNVGRPSEGGFLLQPDYVAGIWQMVYGNGQILQRCWRVPIGDNADSVRIYGIDETSRVAGSRWGGVRAYWVAEAAALTASNPRFRQIELAPKKMAVLVYATSEMLRNPTALEAVINKVVPLEIQFVSEDAIYEGDGSGKPLGATVAPCAISIAAETGQAAATIVYENLIKMWARFSGQGSPGAVWLINRDVTPQLDSLAFAVGLSGLDPRFVAYGPDAVLRIKGVPVIPVEYASTLGTVGDIALVDLEQYAISDRGSVRADSSIHVQFLTDQTCFRFIYEIDGQPTWASAITPFHGVNTISPFVTLATRP